MPPKYKDVEYAFEYKEEERPNLSLTDLDPSKWLAMNTHTEPFPRGEVGWICPVCGRGLAPSMSYCPCKLTGEITYTTQSSTSIYPPNGIEEYGLTMTMPVGAIDYADGSSEIIYTSVDDESRSVD